MGKTVSEKILSEHAGRDLKAGDIAVIRVDLAYVQDGTGPLTVRKMEQMGLESVFNPARCILFLDHASPCPRMELANDHKLLRDFARRTGSVLSDIGNGISHQVVTESYVCPGEVIVGADSHTCTGGALGAFATGMGSSDIGAAFGLGKTWMRVPETFRVAAKGRFQKGVYAKDFIIHLIGLIGDDGATYKAIEYVGEAMEALELAGRLTISNMTVEAGGKAGIFPPDRITRQWLDRMGRGDKFREIRSDPDAHFERTIEIDVNRLEPTVACPHFVDNAKPIGQVGDVPVDMVWIGSSANGRLEDFHQAAQILKGRKAHPRTRIVATPASRAIYLEGMKDGTWEVFVNAGAVITGPGCGPCVGVHEGVLADGDVCVATQPRNFKGRMGNPNAFIYLATPASAAASAVKGKIRDPREFL
jgi:3-isopropylmalate/(R)-2-methylmalate dehydratase large subunit